MIRYMVDGQKLLAMDKWTPVAGTAGAYTLHFTFSDDWAGLTRHAVFKSGETEIAAIINSDSKCNVPWEVLEEPGWLSVGVYGAKSGVRYPTIWERQRQIMPGPDDGTEGTEPTDTLWQQFVDAVAEDAEKAAEAKNAAAASATASAASATAAAESAEDAEDSATAAAASASAAAQDASHAADSEQRSSEHAQSAEESARAAEGHAEAASESEQNAANYARDAEICAMDAASSAEEAKANAEAAKAVWRPSVSDSGVISWTKSDETTAPESQNIRGPKGEDADPALGISGASVGQTVQISAVDGSGKPTAWTAVDTPSGGGGSGAAPVQSVNGKTGAVTLNASDVGADATGTASSAVSAHNSSSSAHQDIRNAIPTIPASLKNPNALTFTGGATGSYDGSAAKTVNIPTTLKNPNALTFTGAVTGTYDGSSALTVNIPSGGGSGEGSSGTDVSLGISGAAVGSIPAVAAVDSNGKPTSWSAENAPTDLYALLTEGGYGGGLPHLLANLETLANDGYAENEDIPTSLKNPNALTFTGGATGSYDGSAAKTVNIPTTLKNPNALTFTGAVTGTYDGSSALTVNIPSGGGSGAAPVQSVNGKTGAVTLNASDVGADATGTASSAVSAHNSSSSAHQDIRNAIPTIPASLKNPNALTFTGGATGSYDGSAAKTVNIPTTLKNPNALTFTGAVTGTYDGSAAKSVAIPEGVPAVTGADNGKVLKVVGGVWTVADAPSGGSSGSSGGSETVDASGWVKIAETTLTAAAETITHTITGSYKEFYLLDYTPTASANGNIILALNGSTFFTGTGYLSNGSGGSSGFTAVNNSRVYHITQLTDRTVAEITTAAVGASYGNAFIGYRDSAAAITQISYSGSVSLPVGTKFAIYGVPAGSSGGGSGSVPEDFVGATDTAAGESGLVPAPAAGNNTKFLRGDGSWATAVPPSTASDAGKFLRVGESGEAAWEASGTWRLHTEQTLAEDVTMWELALPAEWKRLYILMIQGDNPICRNPSTGNKGTYTVTAAASENINSDARSHYIYMQSDPVWCVVDRMGDHNFTSVFSRYVKAGNSGFTPATSAVKIQSDPNPHFGRITIHNWGSGSENVISAGTKIKIMYVE